MATYLILNIIFCLPILIYILITKKIYFKVPVLIIMLLLTLVFDSLIINFGIVDYDKSKILGIYLGAAPLEDFFYTLIAVMLVPIVWNVLLKQYKDKNDR